MSKSAFLSALRSLLPGRVRSEKTGALVGRGIDEEELEGYASRSFPEPTPPEEWVDASSPLDIVVTGPDGKPVHKRAAARSAKKKSQEEKR